VLTAVYGLFLDSHNATICFQCSVRPLVLWWYVKQTMTYFARDSWNADTKKVLLCVPSRPGSTEVGLTITDLSVGWLWKKARFTIRPVCWHFQSWVCLLVIAMLLFSGSFYLTTRCTNCLFIERCLS